MPSVLDTNRGTSDPAFPHTCARQSSSTWRALFPKAELLPGSATQLQTPPSQGLPDPGSPFLPPAPAPFSEPQLLGSGLFTPHRTWTTSPKYRSTCRGSRVLSLSGQGLGSLETQLRNLHPQGKGEDSREAVSEDGLAISQPTLQPPTPSPLRL